MDQKQEPKSVSSILYIHVYIGIGTHFFKWLYRIGIILGIGSVVYETAV